MVKKNSRMYIRFYEELNDFLPSGKKKRTFGHDSSGTPTVKDLIESLGVPHPEIDLILVNSEPVDFSYRPVDGDMVSVYPTFETFDISEVSKLNRAPLRVVRFILDVHLGKLARYLRLLGFDTLYRNDFDDNRIIELGVRESRVILTRDKGILKNKAVTHGLFIRSQHPKEQLTEVIRRLDLSCGSSPLFRCLDCNGHIRKVSKEEVIDLLQPQTRKHFHDFFRCSDCGKVYWEGSHYERMTEFIDNLLANISLPNRRSKITGRN